MTYAEAIARAFDARLLAEIGPDKYRTVIDLNAHADSLGCASHDYCDANEIMDAAFSDVMGRSTIPDNEEAFISEEDTDLWNCAWEAWRAMTA